MTLLEPMTPDGRGMHGYVLRYLGVEAFKLAIVVGWNHSDKTFRVRLWRAATKQWTKSKIKVAQSALSPLTDDEKRDRKAVLGAALDAGSIVLKLRAYA